MAEPTRHYLMGLTEGHPDDKRYAMVDGLILHYRNVNESECGKFLRKAPGILTFCIAEEMAKTGTPPSTDYIMSILDALLMGIAGAHRPYWG